MIYSILFQNSLKKNYFIYISLQSVIVLISVDIKYRMLKFFKSFEIYVKNF